MTDTSKRLDEIKMRFAYNRHLMAEHIDRLERALAELEAPIADFIAKVESGRARSVDSYGKFKDALTEIAEIMNEEPKP